MNPELEIAKDQLWKFQLRREHAQLLKEMGTHQDAFTAFAGDTKATQECLKEQLVGLKSRFERLADDSQKQAQEAKEHWRVIEAKVAEMDNIKAELKVLGIHINNIEVKKSILVQRKCRIFTFFLQLRLLIILFYHKQCQPPSYQILKSAEYLYQKLP